LFIDRKVQPEYLPENEAEDIQRRALQSGRYMTAFLIFFPLLLTSCVHGYYSFIYIAYFLMMLIFSFIFESLDYWDSFSGVVHFVALIGNTGFVAFNFYTNE
jgi:hypothetical protein